MCKYIAEVLNDGLQVDGFDVGLMDSFAVGLIRSLHSFVSESRVPTRTN